MSQRPETRRFEDMFGALRRAKRAGLAVFVAAGDPDEARSLAILESLPDAGTDVIELGIPAALAPLDGPDIRAAYRRALSAGTTLDRACGLVEAFRAGDGTTPLVVVSYAAPLRFHGPAAFFDRARSIGIDAVLIPDADAAPDLRHAARRHGIPVIPLLPAGASPESLGPRLDGARGFVYQASVAGTTGAARPDVAAAVGAVLRLRRHTGLPVALGFGIAGPEQVAAYGQIADLVVVGSAVVRRIESSLDSDGSGDRLATEVGDFVATLSAALGRRY